MKFNNTKATATDLKDGVVMTGKGIAKTVKSTFKLPFSFAKDFSTQGKLLTQAMNEYKERHATASEEPAEPAE